LRGRNDHWCTYESHLLRQVEASYARPFVN
jgi:hypothetical protein